MISISVVIPVYSGESYIEELLEELDKLSNSLISQDAPFCLREVIFVNDNAKDNSAGIIEKYAKNHQWIVLLHLSRNFGQHPATIAGILHSSGDWVVTLDEDLQHPPAQIPRLLLKAVTTGADVVYGKAAVPVHQSLIRDVSSKISKLCISLLSGNKNINKLSSFRLIRGSIARAASSICGHDTYFDVALLWFTDRVEAVSMTLKDRRHIESGQSGYTLRSLLSHGRRLLFSSQLKILRLGALLGFFVVGASIVGGMLLLLVKLMVPSAIDAVGWTSLMITQSFFGGLILLLLGIILEYLSILVLRAHGKPLFFTVNRSSDQELVNYFQKNSQ